MALIGDDLLTMRSIQVSSVYLKSSESGIEELPKEECIRQAAQAKVRDALHEQIPFSVNSMSSDGTVVGSGSIDDISGYMNMTIIVIETNEVGRYKILGFCQWLKVPLYRFKDGIAIESPTCNIDTYGVEGNAESLMAYKYTATGNIGSIPQIEYHEIIQNAKGVKRSGRGGIYMWQLPFNIPIKNKEGTTVGYQNCSELTVAMALAVKTENTAVRNFTAYLSYCHLKLVPQVNFSYNIVDSKIVADGVLKVNRAIYDHWVNVSC